MCHVCGANTLWACSDCRIDFGVTIYVCNTKGCHNAHEEKCPARLREKLTAAQSSLAKAVLEAIDTVNTIDDRCNKATVRFHLHDLFTRMEIKD